MTGFLALILAIIAIKLWIAFYMAKISQGQFDAQLGDWRNRSISSTSRVTPDLNATVAEARRRRGVVIGQPFKLPARDIRGMRVGELLRYARFVQRVADLCGAAAHDSRVGDCVSDVKICEAAS